jgi:hypothetical protein
MLPLEYDSLVVRGKDWEGLLSQLLIKEWVKRKSNSTLLSEYNPFNSQMK